MALASRCESRLQRTYQSLYKVLRELQASRARQSTQPAAPVGAQPEPAAKVQSADEICSNKPKTAVISNAGKTDAEAPSGQMDTGDSPGRNREGAANRGDRELSEKKVYSQL